MYLHFGIDHLLGQQFPQKFSMFGARKKDGLYPYSEKFEGGERTRWGFGAQGWRAIQAFHEMIAASARVGQSVIFDHLTFVDPPVLQDCVERFAGLPVLFVAVKPPREALVDRISHRTATEDTVPPGLAELGLDGAAIARALHALTPWFYDASYVNDCYDLVIDTTKHNPVEVCELIERRLAEGPGTAFDTLRTRFAG
jgi:chloramphenicol 3-O-phosphotransferase